MSLHACSSQALLYSCKGQYKVYFLSTEEPLYIHPHSYLVYVTRKYDEDYKAFNRGKKSFSWEKVKFQRYRAEKMLEIWGNKRVTLRKLRGLVIQEILG